MIETASTRTAQQSDFYGQFLRGAHRCAVCGWSGRGDYMASAITHGLGMDKHCPQCRAVYRFIPWSVVSPDELPLK